jgi:hypothetical protein
MSKVDEYRDSAVECVLLAERARTAADRLRLLAMAKKWRQLAERSEHWNDWETPEGVLDDLGRGARGQAH